MSAPAVAPLLNPRPQHRLETFWAGLRPVWSVPAALRAVRAAVVVPGLFALGSKVIGNPQLATFAAFGGFATLVLAGFGGTRRDKLIAHVGLAATGTALVVIGTAVNNDTALAALVTLPVAFCVLFAGVVSANAASGATAALLAYVLPAASPGTVSMIPSRLEGWWLASAAGTLAVLALSPKPPVNRLRVTASNCAAHLASHLDQVLKGHPSAASREEVVSSKHALLSASTEVPYRPTGLTVADQAIAGLVEALQWSASAVLQAGDAEHGPVPGDSSGQLIEASALTFRLTAQLIAGREAAGQELSEAVGALERLLEERSDLDPTDARSTWHEDLHRAFHSRLVAAAARSAGLDALVAARCVAPVDAADEAARWSGQPVGEDGTGARHPHARAVRRVVRGHTNLRSIWFLNSARGAVALAAAVAVADLTNVQHGFWVVLGALSVLRTSAASTGATALRALAGTVIGFVIGAALIEGIGSHTGALWAALPLAALVAAYSPGTTPFAVGQAAFTVTISVLYNIIVPIGWKVGELRVEDVAIGAGVSAVVGVLFWPRGATAVVARDLAEAFHTGGLYLVQATGWALGVRPTAPELNASLGQAGARLDDALRSLLAEQGSKRVAKENLWRLAGGALRLRLMAHALARNPTPAALPDGEARAMLGQAVTVAGLYDGLASTLGHTAPTVAQELAVLDLAVDQPDLSHPRVEWVRQHIEHLRISLDEMAEPAQVVADRLAVPWWR